MKFQSTGIPALPLRTAIVMLALLASMGIVIPNACAQTPIVAAAPIIATIIKPKVPTGLVKFEGYVTNANSAQITLRDKKNETSLQTFSLSQNASVKMQKVIDDGGYQYGDKVKIYYNPSTRQVMEFKGKHSKPI